MKFRVFLIVTLIMLLSMGVAMAETTPSVTTDNNTISISGNADSAGEDITVIVIDKDNTRHYIDQTITDNDGSYKFKFSLKDGIYIGKISTEIKQYEISIVVKSRTSSEPDDPDDDSDDPKNPVGSGDTGNPQEQRKSFQDIKNHWAVNEIELLAGKGIVSGMNDYYFMPDEKITRAQFATLLYKLLKLEPKEFIGLFEDVKKEDWYSTIVESVSEAGIVVGANGKFYPNNEITREEMAVMIVRTLEYKGISTSSSTLEFNDQDSISSWALDSVSKAAEKGIVKGMTPTTFEPRLGATRAQAAVIIYRLMELL